MTREEAAKILQDSADEVVSAGIEIISRDGGIAVELAIEALMERRTGKWIHGREISREYIGNEIISIQYADWRCSACGMKAADIASSVSFKYCPNCGAKMENGE